MDISKADKNVTIINAEAQAKAIETLNNAKAVTLNNTIFYEKQAYEDTARVLGVNANSGLLDYIYYTNVMKLSGSELLVGLDNALINVQTGGSKRSLENYFDSDAGHQSSFSRSLTDDL